MSQTSKNTLSAALVHKCFVAFVAGSLLPQAQAEASVNLFEYSLEELLTITVASKREEAAYQAPAIVTVVSAEDIRRQGYTSLRDILDRQTNLQIIGSTLFPQNKAVSRGVAVSHTDNSVLLQLNGRPIRDATVSSISSDIYNFFPVSAIKKIEIVRGPGSVLYGTNAFSGVINIVTYDGSEKQQAEVGLGAGSFDTSFVEASGAVAGKSARVYGALYHIDSEGDQIKGVTDRFGVTSTYPLGRRGTQGLLRFDYGGLSLNALASDSRSDNVRSIFAFPSTELGLQRKFFDAGYTHNISGNWSLSANYTYTGIEFRAITLPMQTEPVVGRDQNQHVEVVLKGLAGRKTNIVTGINYTRGENKGATSFTSHSRSFFGQFAYQAMPWLKFVVGAQYHIPDVAQVKLTPRLGVIADFSEYWGMKLLYSSAFREASPLERFTNLPAVVGDPNLSPETIDTLDLQLHYHREQSNFALTLFKSKQKDLVTRITGLPIQIINGGEINYQGIELEGRTPLSKSVSIYGSASYQGSENESGEKGVTYAPDKMLKIGSDYTSKLFTVGVFANYFGSSALQNDSITMNPKADEYTLLTAKVSLNLGRAFGAEQFNAFDAALYLDNILDEDIYFPSVNNTLVNSIPHHSGRGLFFKITGRF